jgi:hypothetical protein
MGDGLIGQPDHPHQSEQGENKKYQLHYGNYKPVKPECNRLPAPERFDASLSIEAFKKSPSGISVSYPEKRVGLFEVLRHQAG